MGYSPERRAAVLKRMLPPINLPVRRLSQEEGISEATLHKWCAQARSNVLLLARARQREQRQAALWSDRLYRISA
jgi:transposase-like protein